MKRIKILYISHSSQMGGAEIALLTLVKYLNRNLFDPVVVLPCQGPLLEEFSRLQVNTHVSTFEWWIRSPWDLGVKGSDISVRLKNIGDIIEKEKPDLIHTNTSVVWEGALLAEIEGIPHVWHIHEILDGHPTLRSLFPLPLVYWAIGMLSERIAVVSNGVKDKLNDYIDTKKLITIYNGVDIERLRLHEGSSIREELSIPETTILGVSIGSLVKEKGYDDLIEAVRLIKNRGENARFIIVGQGTPEAIQILESRIRANGLTDHISYLGYRKDIGNILLSSDFLIHPSITEAFPLVPLEAMAAGKAVIATNCGGMSEMISDDESGFLVPVNDPQALSQKVIYLLKDRGRMKSMGERAFEEASKKYSAASYSAHFEELYKMVLRNTEKTKIFEKESILINALIEIYEELSKQYSEIFEMRSEIERMSGSLSWRITAPLRRIRQIRDSWRN